MTPLFTFTIFMKMDDEKRRSAQVACDKSPEEIVALIKQHPAENCGLSLVEGKVLAWLFENYAEENCACSGCFDSWLEEENLNETVMSAAMLRLINTGWVDVVIPKMEVAN